MNRVVKSAMCRTTIGDLAVAGPRLACVPVVW